MPFIHTICKPAVFAPLEVDTIVKSVIDYETKKCNKSELLIKDNLPIMHELLNKNLINKKFIMFKNKTLLITGGTGSFGNAVLNRF